VAIRPLPCGLSWAQGVVPTPHGPVRVHWHREGGRFIFVVDLPTTLDAEITLPASSVLHSGASAGAIIWV